MAHAASLASCDGLPCHMPHTCPPCRRACGQPCASIRPPPPRLCQLPSRLEAPPPGRQLRPPLWAPASAAAARWSPCRVRTGKPEGCRAESARQLLCSGIGAAVPPKGMACHPHACIPCCTSLHSGRTILHNGRFPHSPPRRGGRRLPVPHQGAGRPAQGLWFVSSGLCRPHGSGRRAGHH